MNLLEKRQETVNLHLMYEKVPESPWCPTNPLMKQRIEAGELKLSDRPIGFLCDDKTVVVGDCVPKIAGYAKSFIDSLAGVDPKKLEGEQKWALKVCSSLSPDANGQLSFGGREWNGLMYALTSQGLQAVVVDGSDLSDA